MILVHFLMLSWLSFAGTNIGGGGTVVVCRDGQNIQSVELLDLWEAKRHLNPYLNLSPRYSDDPVENQIAEAIPRLKGAIELAIDETHGLETATFIAGLL